MLHWMVQKIEKNIVREIIQHVYLKGYQLSLNPVYFMISICNAGEQLSCVQTVFCKAL